MILNVSMRVDKLTFYYNTMGDIMELGKILPSPRKASDKIYVILSGMIPHVRTDMEISVDDNPPMDQLYQQPRMSLQRWNC